MLRTIRFALTTLLAATALNMGSSPAQADGNRGQLPGAVVGHLVDNDGRPMPWIDVILFGNCHHECDDTGTDHSGTFTFDRLTPGVGYCVEFVNIRADEVCFTAVEGTLRLPDQHASWHPGSLRGTVTRADGSPLASATVALFSGAGYGLRGSVTTDADGRYRIPKLLDGPWFVQVSSTGYEPASATTRIDPGRTTVLNLALTSMTPDEAPLAHFTWSRGEGKLVVGGIATDDVGVAKVRVAVRNLSTRNWLRAGGRWGRFDLLAAEETDPGSRRTKWRFKRTLPPGRYGVSLVVVDNAGQRNLEPRPWRVVIVRR